MDRPATTGTEPRNDEGRPRQGDQSSSNSSTPDGTRPRQNKPAATHVFARATYVVSAAGAGRWVLLYRCAPGCGRQHVAHGRGERLPELLERRGPHGGQIVLHVVATPAVAA